MREVKDLLLSEYQESIWNIAYKTIEEYKLIEENNHIAVYIEGNRNSLLTHACVELYRELKQVDFKVSYLLVPSENISIEELVVLARDWGIMEYHIVEDKTETGYMEYVKQLGAKKLLIDLNRDGLMKEYIKNAMVRKKVFEISPTYQMSRFEYLVAIHPFYFVEEKDMKSFESECEVRLLPNPENVERVKQNAYEGIDTTNGFHVNVYQGV